MTLHDDNDTNPRKSIEGPCKLHGNLYIIPQSSSLEPP